ncbi:hypothetical protein sos41_15250 [Alphaproteobacteria bacterium SO-S41]|nr:hypothetical protein sos41_15250 [Alphaproteobacteria bacterium SO-S41]
MYFRIDEDRGDYISGWLLPDNPSRHPKVIVSVDGENAVVSATLTHASMVTGGLHDTGICGFEIGCTDFPALASAKDVRVYDEDTGLLIYVRRGPYAYVEAKLFAFDCREGEESLCAAALASAFHMAYPDLHLVGPDARKACIDARLTTSLYLGGKVHVRALDPYLRGSKFRLAALLADPVDILVGTLLSPSRAEGPDAAERLLDIVRRLDADQQNMLSDPMTRRLTVLNWADKLERDAVAQALDTLSHYEAIGVEADMAAFVSQMAGLCEVDDRVFNGVPSKPRSALAAVLRREPVVQKLIGRDLEIYDAVADAILVANTSE